jgi:hypothetical protein
MIGLWRNVDTIRDYERIGILPKPPPERRRTHPAVGTEEQ